MKVLIRISHMMKTIMMIMINSMKDNNNRMTNFKILKKVNKTHNKVSNLKHITNTNL